MHDCQQNPVVFLERLNITDLCVVSEPSMKRKCITDLVKQVPKCKRRALSAEKEVAEPFFNPSHSQQHEARKVVTEDEAVRQVPTFPSSDVSNNQNCSFKEQSNLSVKKKAVREPDQLLRPPCEDYEPPLIVINCMSSRKNGVNNKHNITLPSSSMNSEVTKSNLNRSHSSNVYYDRSSIKLKDLRVVLVDLFPDQLRAEFKKRMETLANELSPQQPDNKISSNSISYDSFRKNLDTYIVEKVAKHDLRQSSDETRGGSEKQIETSLNVSECNMRNGADISSNTNKCSLKIKEEISSEVNGRSFEIQGKTSRNIDEHSVNNASGPGLGMSEFSLENEVGTSVDQGLCAEYSDDRSYASRPLTLATSEGMSVYTQHSEGNSNDFPHSRSECVTSSECDSANTKFSCSHCLKQFPSKEKLRHHLPEHSIRPFWCKLCRKAFQTSSNLKQHMVSHSNERPYVCEFCSKPFKLNGDRTRHMRNVHKDEKPYPCEHCLIRFKSYDELQDHLRTHIEEKLYSCTLCSRAFSLPGSLMKHMAIHKLSVSDLPSPSGEHSYSEGCPVRIEARSEENGITGECLDGSQENFFDVNERSERDLEDDAGGSSMGVRLTECSLATLAKVTLNSSECVFGEKSETSSNLNKGLEIRTWPILNMNEDCSEKPREASLSKNEAGLENQTGWIKSECIAGHQAGYNWNTSEGNVETQMDESQNMFGGGLENQTEASSNVCESSEIPTGTSLVNEPSLEIQIEASWSMNELQNGIRTNLDCGLPPEFSDECVDNSKPAHSDVSPSPISHSEHSRTHSDNISLSGTELDGSVDSHSTSADGNKFYCTHCLQQFSSRAEWMDHVKEHLDQDPLCTFYAKPLVDASAPNGHPETHSNESEFMCIQCSKVFAKRKHLTKHLKVVHSDNGPFFCPLCPASFKYSRGLGEHFRTHGNGSFPCIWCLQAFPCPRSLKKHRAVCRKKLASSLYTSVTLDEISLNEHARENQAGSRSEVNQCSFENYASIRSEINECSSESLVENSVMEVCSRENPEELEELIRITNENNFEENQPGTRLSVKECFLENRPETVWIRDEGGLEDQQGTGQNMKESRVENEPETVWIRDEGSLEDQHQPNLRMKKSFLENQPEITLTEDEGSSAQGTSLNIKELSLKIRPEVILIEDEGTVEDKGISVNTKESILEKQPGTIWIRDGSSFEDQAWTNSNTEECGLGTHKIVWVRDESSLEGQQEIGLDAEEPSLDIPPETVWIQDEVGFEDQQGAALNLGESSLRNEPETVWISDDDCFEDQTRTGSSMSECNLQNQARVSPTNEADLVCSTSLGLADSCPAESTRSSILESLLLDAKCATGGSDKRALPSSEHSSEEFYPVVGARNTFSCTQCTKQFSSKDEWTKHSVEHFGETPLLGTESFINVSEHMETDSNESHHISAQCSELIDVDADTDPNLQNESVEKRYSCALCPAKFNRPHKLKLHLRTHSGEKPFSCTLCSQAFTQSRYLKWHMTVHSDERPHPCSLCSKRFKLKNNLNYHMRSAHTSERPYACDACPARYKLPRDLRIHLKRAHSTQ